MKRILGAALALGLSHGLGAVGTLIPWATNGGATVSADQVLLLDNGSTEARTAYNPCTININSNFDLTFSVYFGQNEEQCGGDGMAFILQACGTTALGADSGEHAYTGSCANSLAIDFDTFQNVAYGDPAYNSLMIRTGGATASTNASTCGTALIAGPCRPPISALQPIVTDGAYHTVEISWNAATLAMTVAVDGVQSAQWTLPAVYLAGIFGGDSNVYYGWGGSDGGATNFESFSQTSPNPALGCAATPTVVATPTAINAPTNVCGNTPAPTYTALPPSATPSPTPTAYPTLCGAAPALVQSSVVLSGCTLTNPSTAYTVPNNPNQILLVQAESTGPVVSGVALSGTALIQLAGSPLAITGGFVYTYYLANPPVGAGTLSVSASAGCSWNVVATLYDNVNQAGPIGAVHANSGSGNDLMTDTVTTTAGGSLVHDLLAYPNGPFTFSFLTGTPLFPAASSACCDDVFGSYANAGGPGLVTLNYSHTSGAQSWWSEAIELKAAAACGSPTTTPAPTTTPTATVSPSPSPDATPLPETVITASLTYSADDYFEFWINGNQVAAATVFDAGAPPVTVAVPAADFAPGGSPNFIAAEDLNSVANTVGCAWLLTTHNADGSTSYYSSADAGIALYDDTAGASPPPLNGGNNWYQAGWVDAGGLFNQTPVATTAIAWFLPLNLTNPSSGAPIPVLSSNASGLQHSLAEKLYFRESALLVPVTPTFTPGGPSKTASPSQTPFYTATPTPTQSPVFSPTPTPTVTPSPACCNDSDTPTVTPTSSPTNTPVPGSPSLTPSQSYTFTVTPTFTATLTFTAGGPTRSPSPTATFSPTPTGAVTPRSCGIPGLADARNLFKGCYGLANTVTYTVASRPDQLLLVRVENGSAGRPQAVLYGGVALTPFRTDPTYSGGSLSTFYLAGPPAGTAPLEIDYLSGGCSWNVVAELYSGVDQNSPLGAAGAATGTSNSFSTSLSTTGPESLVSDFMALSQASTSSVTLGGGQVDLGYSPQDGCCEEIFGDVKSVGRPGAHTLTYHLNKAKQYTDQLVEVKGWGACGSPTPTPPATLPPRADPPPGDIFTYPQPCRGRALHFAYFMRRPGQANLRIFNAAGVALGGLDEHREAGPEVGTLEVSAFANGVFYYQMEIRYDAGDREMLKVGKFLIVRP